MKVMTKKVVSGAKTELKKVTNMVGTFLSEESNSFQKTE